MADEKYDRMVAKVQKLLAQAQDRAGTAEGDAFSGQAEAIMQKYGIQKAVADAQQAAEQGLQFDKGDVQEKKLFVPAPYAKHKAWLAATIAYYNQCEIVIHPKNRGFGKGCYVSVLGFATDVKTVEMLFLSLSLQATQGVAKQPIPVNVFGDREDPATFRASWLIGFDSGVRSRMAEQRRRAAAEVSRESGTGAELVLRDKASLVKAKTADEYPHLRFSSLSSSGTGRGAGFRAGRNADLGQTRVNGARTAIGQ